MIYRLSMAVIGCLFFHTALFSQIVNIEDRRVVRDTTGWFGQVDLGGQWTRNTASILTLSGSARVDRITDRKEWLFLTNYRMVRTIGRNFIHAGFTHLRFGQELNERLTWEAFTQFQFSEQIRLNGRWLIGTGPRLSILAKEESRAFLGLLYVYEFDDLWDSDLNFRDHRLSAYLSLSLPLSPNTTFANTTYFQPRLLDFDQIRLSTASTLSIGISATVLFTSKFNLTQDARINRVFPEVPKQTFTWANGLRIVF